MVQVVVGGLMLGLSTGAFCLGSCAPAMLPYLVSNGWRGPRVSLRILGEFLAGRLAAYVLFGVLVALCGKQLQAFPFGKRAAALLLMVLAVLVLLHAVQANFPEWRGCAVLKRSATLRRFPFAAGFLLGMNLCLPLLMAGSYFLTVGSWLPCLLAAVAFFLGTVVYLLPLLLFGALGKLATLRGMGEVAAFFSGLWFLAQGLSLWLQA